MTEKRRGRILVIDDDLVAGDVIVNALLPRGLDVLLSASAEEGVQKAQEDPPDLLFVSLFLPDSNGLKLSKRIRALEGFEKLPIVMLITYKGELDPKYTSTIGIVEVLVKPLKPEEVVQKTIKVLGKDALSEETASGSSGEEVETVKADAVSSVWPTEEEGLATDVHPDEVGHAEEEEDVGGYDETEDFLKEEAAGEEMRPLSEEEEKARERSDEEAGLDAEMRPFFEGELPYEEEPRRFFTARRLVVVYAVGVALLLIVAGYGVERVISKSERTARSMKAPAAREIVQESPAGPPVSQETSARETEKAAAPMVEEPRPKDVLKEKKEAHPVAVKDHSAKAKPRKRTESVEKKVSSAPARREYRYSVQVGAFRSEKNAASLAEKLKKKGYDSFIEKDERKPSYRVLVGRFETMKKALVKAKALREDGLKTIVHPGSG